MNKNQIEVEKAKLKLEGDELKHLKGIYNRASKDIAEKIKISDGKINLLLKNFDKLSDTEKTILQSQIYQSQFQLSLQKQINGFMKDLESGQYKSINEYMKACYETGYIGTMYDLAGQGIPLVMPIDQKKVARAMTHNTKLSTTLYKKLGEDIELLKKRIANNISRGIATASSYTEIARNIANHSNMGFNRAMRIARTEGHRIQIEAAVDAQHEAQDAGADIVKQWNAALDGRTRPTHRQLDGQIRELDEPFEVDGMQVMHPSGFGKASEDINCRCALLQRAKWALDEEELEKLKKRAEYFNLDKTKDFEDFENNFLNITKPKGNAGISPLDEKLENEALEWYVSGDGQWINQYLRGNGDFGELSEHEKKMIAAIEKATSRDIIPEGKLYRAVDAEAVFGKMSQIEYENLRNALIYGAENKVGVEALENAMKTKGKTITEKGFMSTTKKRSVAMDWEDFTGSEKPIVLELDVPKGIKGKDLKAFDVEGDEQFEVLLRKNQNYRIKDIVVEKDDWSGSHIVVKGELVANPNVKTVEAIKTSKGLGAKIGGEGLVPLHEEPIVIKMIDYSKKELVKNELENFEKNAIKESIETACVITRNGDVIKCFGTEDRVFPDYDLGDKLIGASVTHNHTVDETTFSFSKDDLQLFMEYNLDILRGCDEKYIYELNRNPADIDDMPIDWMTFENFNHTDIIRLTKEYGIGYRRWKNEQSGS